MAHHMPPSSGITSPSTRDATTFTPAAPDSQAGRALFR
jgi:hypothetical protein